MSSLCVCAQLLPTQECVSGKGETCGLGNKVHLLNSKGQSPCFSIVLNFWESNFSGV